MIVYPAIDLRRGRCVRLRQGRAEDETVYDADPAAAAARWVRQGAEWLHVVNLDGAFGETEGEAGLPVNLQRLAEIQTAVPETPIQFGGGMRSLGDVETALSLGARRAILGTVAVQNPALVAEAVERFGAERIVIGIAARDGQVATHGWVRTSDLSAAILGQAMRAQGVVRVVYTDIARDGMLTGVNVEATAALARETEHSTRPARSLDRNSARLLRAPRALSLLATGSARENAPTERPCGTPGVQTRCRRRPPGKEE